MYKNTTTEKLVDTRNYIKGIIEQLDKEEKEAKDKKLREIWDDRSRMYNELNRIDKELERRNIIL